MPKYTSQVVCRFLKPLSVAYHELANSQHAVNKHRETFVRDKNMGLVNQVRNLLFFCTTLCLCCKKHIHDYGTDCVTHLKFIGLSSNGEYKNSEYEGLRSQVVRKPLYSEFLY